MKTRASRVLGKLRRGLYPTMLKTNLSDPRIVELAGICGVDSVWLCQEHVPNDWINLEGQIRAARVHDVDTIVRVSKGSYSDFVRPFEADATGIMVPFVSNAEEARQIVEWVRFHPIGKRPLDGGNVDGMFCQLPLNDYIKNANEERIVILQIESPEALENVEEIAAVPGYDALLFGPGDFSHRLGTPGEIDTPQIHAARRRVAAAARAHGKFAMALVLGPVGELVAEGFQLFSIGADVIGLGEYFRKQVDTIQADLDALAKKG